MRFIVAALLWIVTTIALAAAVPAMWAQQQVIDPDGFTQLAESAAQDPQLQRAVAAELTTQVVSIAGNEGYDLDAAQVRRVAAGYTSSSGFPRQFAEVARIGHQWLFTGAGDQSGQWTLDLAPMLKDTSIQETLDDLGIQVPQTVTVPVMVDENARPGRLQQLTTWGPWVSLGAAVLTGFLALLTLAVARGRAKAVAALGVSALLVGGAGWAAIEMVRGRVDTAIGNATTGDLQRIADGLVTAAQDSAHHWLNINLISGAGLAVLGVLFAVLGSMPRTRS